MKDKTATERMIRYRPARDKRGLVVVQLTVPVERREEIKRIAREMREGK